MIACRSAEEKATRFVFVAFLSAFFASEARALSFAPQVLYDTGGQNAWDLVAADFNNDGLLDLAVTNYNSDSVSIFYGVGAGAFGSPTILAVGSGPRGIVAGDFNLDGWVDLAVANEQSFSVSVLLGGSSGFGAASSVSTNGNWAFDIAAADFDHDGHLDMALTGVAGPHNLFLLLGDGNGGFSFSGLPPLANGARAIEVGKFNGDGNWDLAVTGMNGVNVLVGDGTGGFPSSAFFPAGGIHNEGIVARDLNGDGKTDLALTNVDLNNLNNVSILFGDGAGNFGAATNFQGGSFPWGIVAGDFDLDGKVDLALANNGFYGVSVLLGDGSGQFGPPNFFAAPPGNAGGFSGRGLVSADFDQDGRLDLAIAYVSAEGVGSQNVGILLNTTPFPGAEPVPEPGSLALFGIGLGSALFPLLRSRNT